MSEAAAALTFWQHNHMQGATIPPRSEQPHRYDLVEYIAALSPTPRTIVELGCSSARNLAIARRYLPDAELIGIEPNETTYGVARAAHRDTLELYHGDHTLLDQFKDDAFDVAFSCSVLDHIPAPEWRTAYDELVRVARHHIVLLEPMYLGADDQWVDDECGRVGIAAPGYSYVHNYHGHDARLVCVREMPVVALPQWERFGSLYALLHREK